MTADEVVQFINHKYGESAYLIRTDNELRVFTAKSIWRIFLNDYRKFGHLTMYHSNNKTNDGHFHKQAVGTNCSYNVYYAIMHDLNIGPYDMIAWEQFQKSYDLVKYGQELWSSVCTFEYLTAD